MNLRLICAAVLAAGVSLPVLAAGGMADRVGIGDPYVRMAPPNARATGAFMVLRNAADRDAALVKADSPAAKIVELHNHVNDGGVMRMREVKEIVVPARGEVALKPGSYHVMLIDMKAPLQEGGEVVIHLGFADGSRKEVRAPVRAGPGHMKH
ncbi:MAG: copper chaperone PCu(A)C [Sulfuritalea sp.]|nr:copper chaperone PCu(A)C [Sulfuritalea sp.]